MNNKNFYLETIHKEYLAENDPVFFDTSEFPWVAELERDYDKIMDCLAPVFEDGFEGLMTITETQIQWPPKQWKGLFFYLNGIRFKKNLRQFPYLAEKLGRIPHLIYAKVSVLEPGARILPHNGNTNAIIRAHLGLKVPGKQPECSMTIDGNEISWEEGKLFMFCNMKEHQVQNLTDKRRYVLMLDVMRPEFVHLKKKICVHVNARLFTNMLLNIARAMLGRWWVKST